VDYELIIVGGGLAGSTLAKNMAERGTRVLLLEREHAFRDRIRGEAMHPWGVVEARALGIYDELLDACGHVCNRWKTYFDGQLASDRDLLETNPHESGEFHFYHPAMQELLIGLAGRAGVDVHRGARLTGLDLEARRVTWAEDGEVFEATADLVVGADGSRSTVRRHAGFDVNEDQDYLMIAGVMLENAGVPDDSVHQFHGAGVFSILFPQGSGRTRSYVGYPSANAPCRLAGEAQKAEYLELLKRAGVPENWLPEAELTGPLAEFQGADKWVDHPAWCWWAMRPRNPIRAGGRVCHSHCATCGHCAMSSWQPGTGTQRFTATRRPTTPTTSRFTGWRTGSLICSGMKVRRRTLGGQPCCRDWSSAARRTSSDWDRSRRPSSTQPADLLICTLAAASLKTAGSIRSPGCHPGVCL
jgi:2-polyprenyl-6-methoxyphenol hydroxylase-like FAD-dependent oxidoreductase